MKSSAEDVISEPQDASAADKKKKKKKGGKAEPAPAAAPAAPAEATIAASDTAAAVIPGSDSTAPADSVADEAPALAEAAPKGDAASSPAAAIDATAPGPAAVSTFPTKVPTGAMPRTPTVTPADSAPDTPAANARAALLATHTDSNNSTDSTSLGSMRLMPSGLSLDDTAEAGPAHGGPNDAAGDSAAADAAVMLLSPNRTPRVSLDNGARGVSGGGGGNGDVGASGAACREMHREPTSTPAEPVSITNNIVVAASKDDHNPQGDEILSGTSGSVQNVAQELARRAQDHGLQSAPAPKAVPPARPASVIKTVPGASGGSATDAGASSLSKSHNVTPRSSSASLPASEHDRANTVNASMVLQMGAFKLKPLEDFVPYDELVAMRLEDGIDATRREDYLSDADFLRVFGMDREGYAAMPAWKKQAAKKNVRLF